MKYRLTALVALAAIVALPAVASAATMHHPEAIAPRVSEQTIIGGPAVGTETDDAAMNAADAEHAYLAAVCPTVLSQPGNYSGVLVTFCREPRG